MGPLPRTQACSPPSPWTRLTLQKGRVARESGPVGLPLGCGGSSRPGDLGNTWLSLGTLSREEAGPSRTHLLASVVVRGAPCAES